MSMDPQALADAEGGGGLDVVPGAELADGGVILDGKCAKRVAGLDGVELRRGDIVVMAGLGGNNMIDIMSRVIKRDDKDLLKTVIWVLQPQKSSDKLREFLFTNGFVITDENACEDRGMRYLLIKTVYTGMPSEFTLPEKFYGPVILRRAAEGEAQVLAYTQKLDKRFELSKKGNDEVRRMLEEKEK